MYGIVTVKLPVETSQVTQSSNFQTYLHLSTLEKLTPFKN